MTLEKVKGKREVGDRMVGSRPIRKLPLVPNQNIANTYTARNRILRHLLKKIHGLNSSGTTRKRQRIMIKISSRGTTKI